MSEKQHKKWTILVNGWGEESRVRTEFAHRYISSMDELVEKAKAQGFQHERLEWNRLKIQREED